MEINLNSSLSSITSVSLCLILTGLYVVSLYIWKREHDRNHPETVKKRFCSVIVVTIVSLAFVYFFSNQNFLKNVTISRILGLHTNGLLTAIIVSFLLTAILFAGPLYVEYQNGHAKSYFDSSYWINGMKDLLWVRNHIMAPLTEELTFRACIMAILIQAFSPKTVLWITPYFFGVAHFHHLIEMKYNGTDTKTALIVCTFQFIYTTIFGYYATYLFAKTGHFTAAFVAHCFCNHMGFPDIRQVIEAEGKRKISFIFAYVFGLVMWLFLLPHLTKPSWFDNKLYWKEN